MSPTGAGKDRSFKCIRLLLLLDPMEAGREEDRLEPVRECPRFSVLPEAEAAAASSVGDGRDATFGDDGTISGGCSRGSSSLGDAGGGVVFGGDDTADGSSFMSISSMASSALL